MKKIKDIIQKINTWIRTNKKKTLIILVIFIGLLAWGPKLFGKNTADAQYTIALVEKGNIISSVSGTGQVSASNQIDFTSKVSGEVLKVNVSAGQEVKAGTLIAEIDPGQAGYELQTAKLSYDQFVNIDPDELETDKENVESSYLNTRNVLSSGSTSMSDVVYGLNDLRNDYLSYANKQFDDSESAYVGKAVSSYFKASDSLKDFLKDYANVNLTTDNTIIIKMTDEAYQTVLLLTSATKDTKDAVVYLRSREDDPNTSNATSAYDTIVSLSSKINDTLNSLSSAKDSVKKAEETLNDLKDGPDTVDLRSQQLSLQQKEDAYEDYFIRAPFDGIVASTGVKVGDSINNGAAIATLITKQKVVDISLNEIDAAKVALGQKVTMTFDAVPDLTITGIVSDVNLVGKVNQGVVSYTIKITFDTDDDRIKTGMTVSADIIINIKQDILKVKNSAIKTIGDTAYVQVFDQTQDGVSSSSTLDSEVSPTSVPVVIGISDDDSTEIVSGLQVGDKYVVRTISTTTTSSKTTSTQEAPSLFGSTSGGGFNRSNFSSGGFGR